MTVIKQVSATETKYSDMKDVAKLLEINYVGKSREELAAAINAEIEKRGGEITMEEVKQEVQETTTNEATSTESGEASENKETTNEGGKEAGETTTPAVAKKWHEDGYGNKPGDRVTIIGKHVHQNTDHPKVILQGRTAVVVGPSKKANMIQAKLIDQKSGSEQDCIITLAFGEYADEGTVDVAIPPRKTRKKAETPAEEVTATQTDAPVADAGQTGEGENQPAAEGNENPVSETTEETAPKSEDAENGAEDKEKQAS